jgi:hypothetical protein
LSPGPDRKAESPFAMPFPSPESTASGRCETYRFGPDDGGRPDLTSDLRTTRPIAGATP